MPHFRLPSSTERGLHPLRIASRPRVLLANGKGHMLVQGLSLEQALRLMTFSRPKRMAWTLRLSTAVLAATAAMRSAADGRRLGALRGYVDRSIPPRPLVRFIKHALPAGFEVYIVELFGGALGAFAEGALQSHCEVIGTTCVDLDPVSCASYSQLYKRTNQAVFTVDVRVFDLDGHLRAVRQRYPGTTAWLHASPPCSDICGQNAEGDARARNARISRGISLTLAALALIEKMLAAGLAAHATLENVKEAALTLRQAVASSLQAKTLGLVLPKVSSQPKAPACARASTRRVTGQADVSCMALAGLPAAYTHPESSTCCSFRSTSATRTGSSASSTLSAAALSTTTAARRRPA